MAIFKHCVHKYKVVAKSNIIREMYERHGYWERLCKCECERCGKIEEQWIESDSVTACWESPYNFTRINWEKV